MKVKLALAILTSIALLFFIIITSWIGFEIKSLCVDVKKYENDCVTSLSQVAQDENQSFHMRNDAVWALGQLGDARALPTLKSLYTGAIPAREPYNEVLSQYELQKAIKLLSGGTNITAPFWRFLIN